MDTESCPFCGSKETIKKGFYKRKPKYAVVNLREAIKRPSLYQRIQKYECKKCGKNFSDQSKSPDWNHKRPDLNDAVRGMVGMGDRRMALALRTTKKTIRRKILFNGDKCAAFNHAYMGKWNREIKPRFQMDEMESFLERRNQSIKIPTVVERDSHFIVSVAPVIVKSRSHYPRAQDAWNNPQHEAIMKKNVYVTEILKECRRMKPEGRIVLETDKDASYPKVVKDAFGESVIHTVYNASAEEAHELFSVNNIMACLRQDVAAVRKDSWHVAKSKKMLEARLNIYAFHSNFTKKKTYKIDGKRKEMTPAMHLGIFAEPVESPY